MRDIRDAAQQPDLLERLELEMRDPVQPGAPQRIDLRAVDFAERMQMSGQAVAEAALDRAIAIMRRPERDLASRLGERAAGAIADGEFDLRHGGARPESASAGGGARGGPLRGSASAASAFGTSIMRNVWFARLSIGAGRAHFQRGRNDLSLRA